MFKIIGTGMYLPSKLVTNQELYDRFGMEPLKTIFERIGHGARYYSAADESSAELAEKAGKEALKDAKIDPLDIQLLIVASDTPAYLSPATAAKVQYTLNLKNAAAFDINCACAGFVTALDIASRYLDGKKYRNIMIIGTYAMSKFLDSDDPIATPLFGDGAGAVIISYDPSKGPVASTLKADGSYWDYMGIYGCGSMKPASQEVLNKKEHTVKILKKFPATLNSDEWPILIEKTLSSINLRPSDVDAYVFTQIRKMTIEEVMNKFSLPMSKTHTIMEKWGYTGSACIPMAFHDMIKQGKVKRGQRVLMCASGGGYAMACLTFVY